MLFLSSAALVRECIQKYYYLVVWVFMYAMFCTIPAASTVTMNPAPTLIATMAEGAGDVDVDVDDALGEVEGTVE